MKTIFTVLMLISAACGMQAQTPVAEKQVPRQSSNKPERPKKLSPEEIAKKKADMMKQEVSLTDKQYKKVYKLFKNDETYRQEQDNPFGGGMSPFGGGGPGMGGPGSGMGGPGGGMGGPGGGMGVSVSRVTY